jgi:hypothetical protein
MKLKSPKFVPCYFHNLSNYDAHFIITELGYDAQTISVIPHSEEKFISFSKYRSPKFTIRFIDTLRFMASSLENLVNNLEKDKFHETSKEFPNSDLGLIIRKGVYPYEYTDSWEKLKETKLPDIEHFYSHLTEKNITENDYIHAQNIWTHFNCKTLGDYSDAYLKLDVLLLCDIFESFRDLCLTAYGLDPCYYYTAPGMSFDCMLKNTKVELELLHDIDMLLMFESGIRGGITQAVKRYSKANNHTIENYDPKKPDTWIIYLDATNL